MDYNTLADAAYAALFVRSIVYVAPRFESETQADALADAFMAGGKAALEIVVEANKHV